MFTPPESIELWTVNSVAVFIDPDTRTATAVIEDGIKTFDFPINTVYWNGTKVSLVDFLNTKEKGNGFNQI